MRSATIPSSIVLGALLFAGRDPAAAQQTCATGASGRWTGAPSGLALLAVVDVDGTPFFVPVLITTFDGGGVFALAPTVPSGLQVDRFACRVAQPALLTAPGTPPPAAATSRR